MDFHELSNEQRRQLIDTAQVFTAWRDARDRFEHSYKGTLKWVKRPSGDYLVRKTGKAERGLGPRSAETERLKAEYDPARKTLQSRQKGLKLKLGQMARVNKALYLGRVPKIAALILRVLDDSGLMGTALHVVGTNALFAYETRAGVRLQSDILATGDADLLWDARRSLKLTGDVKAEGLLGLLRKVDRSFSSLGPRSFRAANDEGYMVDLIRPVQGARARWEEKIGNAKDDLHGVDIEGLNWLVNSPKFEEVVIGEDGLPLLMACVDPRAYAVHKAWVATRSDRKPIQKARDLEQSRIVAALCKQYFGLKFSAPDLTAIPKALLKGFT
jgi:hypothetical protein